MPEQNDPALLAATPGASLAALANPRAKTLAAEITRLDHLVATAAAATLDPFDAPADFRRALGILE